MVAMIVLPTEESFSHLVQPGLGRRSRMGNVGLTFAVVLLCGSPSTLYAQARVEAGLLFDYLSIWQTNTNNFGLGGRLGYASIAI
jgi:hypothetical protein